MLLIIGITSAVLTVTYVKYTTQVMANIKGMVLDITAISQLAQKHIPPAADRDQAINDYEKALMEYGLTNTQNHSLSYALTSPSGQVLKSTNPGLVGQKFKTKKKPAAKRLRALVFLDCHGSASDLGRARGAR